MAEAENIAIGRRLAAARQGAGLSMRQLAERLGWPHTTLGNYESGRRALPVARLLEIAQALGRSPAALLLDPPEAAAVADQLAGNVELSIQVAYFLETLAQPIPDDPTGL